MTGSGDSGQGGDTIKKKRGSARRVGETAHERENLGPDPQHLIRRPSQAKLVCSSSSGEVETEGPLGDFWSASLVELQVQ